MHTNNGFLRFAKIAAAALMTVVASGIRAQSSYMATEAFVTNHIAQEAARADQRMDEEIAKIATKTVITTNTIPGVVPPVEVITTNIYPIAYSDDVSKSLESARQYTDGAISNIETDIDAKRDYTDLSYNITTATVQKSAWEVYSLNTITGGVSDTAVLVDVQRGESSGRQYENWTGVSVKGTDVSLTIYPNDAYAAINWGGNYGFISDFSGESFKVPAYAGTNTEITVELKSTNSIALQSSVDYVQSYAQGLSNAIKKVAFTGSYNDLTDTPSINGVNLSGDTAISNIGVRAYNDLSFSGVWKVNIFGSVVRSDSAYLIGKETIPTPPQMTRQVKWTGTSKLGKYVVLNENELTNEIDWELNYDPYSSSPAIFSTRTAKTPEPTTLQWGDKASGEKVEGDSLALLSDATLTEREGFADWRVFRDGVEVTSQVLGLPYPDEPDYEDTEWVVTDCRLSQDYPRETYVQGGINATNLQWIAFYEEGVQVRDVSYRATRTPLQGYRLGPDSQDNPNRNKPVASEAEAEALRDSVAALQSGKQDALTPTQLANIEAVPGKLDKTAVVAPSTAAADAGKAADAKATGDALEPLLFAQYYPDGSVKSAAEFTNGIKYNVPVTVNRTITVKPFCNTGTAADNNSSLAGRVVIPPFVDAQCNPYITDDGTRFKVIGVANGVAGGGLQSATTAIYAPNTVTNIGEYAFNNCSSLVSVSLPGAVVIGDQAFAKCNLTSVSIPAATSIGDSAFVRCDSLVSVVFPAATNISSNVFGRCSSLASVSLPSATSVGAYAFYQDFYIKSVDFGATPRESVPTLGSDAFYQVVCTIIVPDSQYDAWIAEKLPDGTTDNPWYDLVTAGCKFLKHSEWEYARKYEIAEASELSVRNEFGSWSLTPDSKGDDAITIVWDSTDKGWVLYFQGAKSSSALGSFYGSEHLVWTNDALQISGVSSVVADRERLPGYILGDQTNKVLAAQSEFDALSTNLATKADTTLAELTELSDWTILRNGADVTGQVVQPSYDSGWTVYNSVISGDYGVSEAEGDANATNLSWTANDGSVQYIATRSPLPGYILGMQTNKVLAAQSYLSSNYYTKAEAASKTDATLTANPPKWVCSPASYEYDSPDYGRVPVRPGIVWYDESPTGGPSGWYIDGGPDGPSYISNDENATTLSKTYEGEAVTATRTGFGYVLGSQTNKVLATEGEAEELRARLSGVAISATNYTDTAVSNAFVMLTVIDDCLVPSEGAGSGSVYYTDAQVAVYLDRHFPDWTTSSSNQIAVFRNSSSSESSAWRYDKELFVDQIVFALKGTQSSSSHFRRSVTFPVQGVYRVTVEYAPIMQQTTHFSVDIGVKCSGGDAVWQSLGTQDYSKRNSTSMLVSASKGAGHIEIMSKEAANTGFVFSRLKVELVSKIGVEVAEIDDHLDANSTNPVQNKVISETIDGLATTSMVNVAVSVAMKSYQTLSSPNPVHGTGGTNTYTMANNSCNYVTQGASAPYPTAIVFKFPTVEGDEARNFSVYYACSDYTKSGIILPDVAILVVDGDSSSIACENGINLFTFKEVRRNEFVVTRQTVAPVGQ